MLEVRSGRSCEIVVLELLVSASVLLSPATSCRATLAALCCPFIRSSIVLLSLADECIAQSDHEQQLQGREMDSGLGKSSAFQVLENFEYTLIRLFMASGSVLAALHSSTQLYPALPGSTLALRAILPHHMPEIIAGHSLGGGKACIRDCLRFIGGFPGVADVITRTLQCEICTARLSSGH